MTAVKPLKEAEIPDLYNEIDIGGDNDLILRTLTNFQLYDEFGSLVSIEAITTDPDRKLFLSGNVVQPLDAKWQQTILDNLCTVPPKLDDEEIGGMPGRYAATADAAVEPDVDIVFDRLALKAGDSVDSYCNKTFKWYEAKVVDTKIDNDGRSLVKVHFLGWKSRFDEWLERTDERIAARGHAARLLSQAEKQASKLVAWYQHHKIYAKASETLKLPVANRASQPVVIEDIEDWCIDLTYAAPNLWIIAKSGIWYRLAGVLAPHGCRGNPAPEYNSVYQETFWKFYITAHTAMVLLDLLPTNPRLSFSQTVAEVTSRTGEEFAELAILQHYSFIAEQLCGLARPETLDWAAMPKLEIATCPCVAMLKKEGAQFRAAGGISGVLSNAKHTSKRRLAMAQQYALAAHWDIPDEDEDKPEGPKSSSKKKTPKKVSTSSNLEDDLDAWADNIAVGSSNGDVSSHHAAGISEDAFLGIGDEVKRVAVHAHSKRKYPIDDDELWASGGYDRIKGLFKVPHPVPKSEQFKCPPQLVDLLLSTWATLVNFRAMLKLPYVSLETYQAAILSPRALHTISREIFTSLLSVVLWEKGRMPNQVLANTDKTAYADEDGDHFCINTLTFPDIESEHHLQSWLRVGDIWLEITRLLIAEKQRVAIPEALDPLGECEAILDNLMKQADAVAFCNPIDPIADNLPSYWDIVTSPMDFNTIKHRLQTNWYSPRIEEIEEVEEDTAEADDMIVTNELETTDDSTADQQLWKVGSVVDVFLDQLNRWYLAEIVGVAEEGQSYELQCVGFGLGKNIVVNKKSNRIRKAFSVTTDHTTRYTHPDELDSIDAAATSAASQEAQDQAMDLDEPAAVSTKAAKKLETSSKPPPYSLRSKHRGHEGFTEDMLQIFSNCEMYFDAMGEPENQFVEVAKHLQRAFQQQMEKRVLTPLAQQQQLRQRLLQGRDLQSPLSPIRKEQGADSASSSSAAAGLQSPSLRYYDDYAKKWSEDVHLLSQSDYADLQPALRLRLINWLCNEMLSTSMAHAYVDKIIHERKNVRKSLPSSSAATATGNNTAGDGDEAGASGTGADAGNGDDGRADANNVGAADTAAAPATATKKSRGHKSRATNLDEDGEPTTGGNIKAVINPWTPCFRLLYSEPLDEKESLNIRLKPLGEDRDHRSYWVFPQDRLVRVFCRNIDNPQNICWHIYSGDQQINLLMTWLCEKGIRENSLRKSILSYLDSKIDTGFGVQDKEDTFRPNASAEDELPTSAPVDKKDERGDAEEQGDEEEELGTGKRKRRLSALATEIAAKKKPKPVGRPLVVGVANESTPPSTTPTEERDWVTIDDSVDDENVDEITGSYDPNRWHYVANFLSLYHTGLETPVSLVADVDLSVIGQLGLGVKELDGQVLVTSYKYTPVPNSATEESISTAKAAGVRVGDRILFANDILIRSISDLQNALKQMASTSANAVPAGWKHKHVYLQLLRRCHIKAVPGLAETGQKEASIGSALNTQEEIDHAYLRYISRSADTIKVEPTTATDESSPSIRTTNEELKAFGERFGTTTRKILQEAYLNDQPWLPSNLLGLLYDMLTNTLHPYLVSHAWLTNQAPYWLQAIKTCVLDIYCLSHNRTPVDPTTGLNSKQKTTSAGVRKLTQAERKRIQSQVKDLYQLIAGCLKQFELVLFHRGNGLLPTWMNPTSGYHIRRKWQIACQDASSYAKVSLVLSILLQAIDWRKYVTACYPITKKNGSLSDDFSYAKWGLDVAEEASTVVYYGEGHAELLQRHRQKSPYSKHADIRETVVKTSGHLWGGSVQYPALDKPVLGRVTGVRFFLAGSVQDLSTCQPFVQVDVAVLKPSALTRMVPPALWRAPAVGAEPTTAVLDAEQLQRQQLSLPLAYTKSYHLSKVLHRVIDVLRLSPDATPFMYPVSKKDFPDYYIKILRPMSLSEMVEKIANRRYPNLSRFVSDMDLIKANCLEYCAEDFPEVAASAVRLHDEMTVLIQTVFQADLENASAADDEQLKSGMVVNSASGTEFFPKIGTVPTMYPHLVSDTDENRNDTTGSSLAGTILKHTKELSVDVSDGVKTASNNVFDPRFGFKNPIKMYLKLSRLYLVNMWQVAPIENAVQAPPTAAENIAAATLPPASTTDNSSSSSSSAVVEQATTLEDLYALKAMSVAIPLKVSSASGNGALIDRNRYFAAIKGNFALGGRVRTLTRPSLKNYQTLKNKESLELPPREGVIDSVKSVADEMGSSSSANIMPWRWLKVVWNESSNGDLVRPGNTQLDEHGIPGQSLCFNSRYVTFENPWDLEYIEYDRK